ncbi:hypothetical protein FACS1894217_14930 [Clostridia bacterium]|nr:hypothetical protein FACS1894217_14930 [Clostridia bacterium]
MEAYRAYYDGGRITPMPSIPNGSEIILTVLGKPTESRAERQRRAFQKFSAAMKNSNEPLGAEFDEIINRRVNFTRELEL